METGNGDLRVTVQQLTVDVAVLEERLRASKDALANQATEYARRLAELNQAHDRAERVLSTYITRDLFDQTVREWSEWRRAVDAERATNSGRNSTFAAIGAAVLAVSSLGISLLTFFFKGG